MIITRQTALKLIRQGKAKPESVIVTNTQYGDKLYVALTRYDKQRTDHYPAIYRDQRSFKSDTTPRRRP